MSSLTSNTFDVYSYALFICPLSCEQRVFIIKHVFGFSSTSDILTLPFFFFLISVTGVSSVFFFFLLKHSALVSLIFSIVSCFSFHCDDYFLSFTKFGLIYLSHSPRVLRWKRESLNQGYSLFLIVVDITFTQLL